MCDLTQFNWLSFVGIGYVDVEVVTDEFEVTALQITLECQGLLVQSYQRRRLVDLAFKTAVCPPMIDVDVNGAVDTDSGLWVMDYLVVPGRQLAGSELFGSD